MTRPRQADVLEQARRWLRDQSETNVRALLSTIEDHFAPEPENACSWCGKTDSQNYADGFGPCTDVLVQVAYQEEGYSRLLRYACQEHMEWLTDEFARLGFVSHHHGSTTLLEDRDCPGYETYGTCPTPRGYGEAEEDE